MFYFLSLCDLARSVLDNQKCIKCIQGLKQFKINVIACNENESLNFLSENMNQS